MLGFNFDLFAFTISPALLKINTKEIDVRYILIKDVTNIDYRQKK